MFNYQEDVAMIEAESKKKTVYVKMANTLNRATHSLTVVERRILMLAISKLKNKKYIGNPSILVTALEIAEHAGITPEAAYQSLTAANKQLSNRSITLLCDLVTGEPKRGHTRWVVTSYYEPKSGCIELLLNHELLPYFSALHEYTSYDRARTGGFRSIYSCRLFDLVMQFKTKGKFPINIEKLADVLEVPKSLRSNFANMRSRAIEPAIKEIREKDGLSISWRPLRKVGRKVTVLEFTFPAEQQVAVELPPRKKTTKKSAPKPALTPEQIAKREAALEAAAQAAGDEAMAKLLQKVTT